MEFCCKRSYNGAMRSDMLAMGFHEIRSLEIGASDIIKSLQVVYQFRAELMMGFNVIRYKLYELSRNKLRGW
jgi:hypothetical protein